MVIIKPATPIAHMANPPNSTRPAAPVDTALGDALDELLVPDEPEDVFVLVAVAVALTAASTVSEPF